MRILTAALGMVFTLGTSVLADTLPPKNPMIDIAYDVPKTQDYKPIYQRLKDLQVLETLQEFLSPLILPRKILVKAEECGTQRLVYKPGGPAVVCYEYIDAVIRFAPHSDTLPMGGDGRISKDATIAGATAGELLNEVSHAVFDVLQIPVWGSLDDAADNSAALIMLQFGDLAAWRTLTGTSWFLAQRSFSGIQDFTDIYQAGDAARFYNYLCIAYAGNNAAFSFLEKDIPQERRDTCSGDYRKLVRSFKQTIMPHIDQALLKQSSTVDWAAHLTAAKN
jgi:hypothetical protein